MDRIYDPKVIEPKWQKFWEDHQTFRTDVWDFSKPKFYALDMFPYPSGVGLHAGHPEGNTATDIVSRMKRGALCLIQNYEFRIQNYFLIPI